MNTRLLALSLIVLVTLVACKSGSDGTGEAAKSEPPPKPNPLVAAATGSYEGPFGKLEFRDGTATFALQNCAFETPEVGIVKMSPGAGCSDDTREGTLVIKDHGFGIKVANGNEYLYGAYVDEAGALHVGIGEAAELGEDKKGQIELSPLLTLTIGETCKLDDKMTDAPRDVPCRFVERSGLQILEYEIEDRFEKGKMVTEGLVHFPKLGLLVSPQLVPMAFTRKP